MIGRGPNDVVRRANASRRIEARMPIADNCLGLAELSGFSPGQRAPSRTNVTKPHDLRLAKAEHRRPKHLVAALAID